LRSGGSALRLRVRDRFANLSFVETKRLIQVRNATMETILAAMDVVLLVSKRKGIGVSRDRILIANGCVEMKISTSKGNWTPTATNTFSMRKNAIQKVVGAQPLVSQN
jgi:hypothetical protein